MSRSYKKNPISTDGSPGSTHHSKKLANRKLRKSLNNSDELLQGSKYKRHSESYDIHDWKFRYSHEEASRDYDTELDSWFKKQYPTKEAYMKWWRKHYLNK